MSLLDSQPNTETSRDELMILIVAIVRAYGSQEASHKASRVIIDEYELKAAVEVVTQGGVNLYRMEPGSMTSLDSDRSLTPDITRYVIEVK